MNFYIDTEFVEKPCTIDLISIGITTANGNHYYAISSEFNVDEAWNHPFVKEHVLKSIYGAAIKKEDRMNRPFNLITMDYIRNTYGQSRSEIAKEIKEFVSRHYDGGPPKFYGYYCDYDWVAFCWLFGTMMQLPEGYPMFCIDLKQMMEERNLDSEWKRKNCPDPDGEHDALVDAIWNKRLHYMISLVDVNKGVVV